MKPIERFLKNFDEQFKKAKFKNIKPDKSNLNKIYENNISIWYYFHSDKVEKKDGTKEINSELDTINHIILKNPENFIFCKTKDGFSLTESDFINSELSIIDTIENFSISEKKQFDFYKNYILNKLKQLQQIETKNPDKVKNEHPEHNPNLWNIECYKLFKYLFDNYYTKTKRQLTNIWFYLNEYDPIKYNLKATKDEYIIFIKTNYSISITNFDKAQHKFQKEYGTINEHRTNFEDDF